jgi:hypothetical protein
MTSIKTLGVSLVAGALVWGFSPILVGHNEPWDVAPWFYPTVLFIAGVAAGWIAPKPLWAHYWGVVLGQLAYELLFQQAGALVLLGLLFLLPYALVYCLAVVLVATRKRTKGGDETV